MLSRTNTILLIAILIAAFIFINVLVKSLNITPIDCTESQDFTLTDESKERVKDINKEIKIYFVGWADTDVNYSLAKQYNKVNSNIKVELIDATKNLEIANKYDVTNEDEAIIIDGGKKSKTLTYYDVVTYDSEYNEVNLAEQKITSAIINVASDDVPKIYFLDGYSSLSVGEEGTGLTLFSQYLNDEALEYENLNILNTQKIPEDCSTLVIMTPKKDFDKITTDKILEYINKGGNILWLNSEYTEKMDLPNVNKILAQYGVNAFENGYIFETNKDKYVLGYQSCFMPDVQETEFTKGISQNAGVIFLNPTKININTDKLEELNVEETDLITTGNTTYFTTDLTGASLGDEDGEGGSFVLGAKMEKTISSDKEKDDDEENEENEENELKSTLVIYGDNYFIADQNLTDTSGNRYYMPYLANNADLALNSLAYLSNNYQDITIRKSYSDSETSFTPTEGEKSTIMKVIFIVPVAVMGIGLIVWIKRKNRT